MTEVFKYSDEAHYPHAGVFNKKLINIIKQSIIRWKKLQRGFPKCL